ncbi:MAG: 1-deoxy-D-xylulose-5-phosphate synthase [Prochlorococcaceae cyanobacterium MAG_34]|jgi:1-deoxy-D-xylulose-5-phosphate synthase|uniref:1-deoxy-D-xylulose-5-phosphate synthase n=2 Tax=Cyanobium TaxID=167375 RepID=UPI000715FFE5|nr:1-deoxy-D-xylulose-5-phosphate synthase [Cyanobium usitatum]KRO92247.1 MAG: 1-deoxy-D-xylulose-5-phosphate synthase [cyanobacterium BACL30 MAG-120619-bin27]MDP4681961.1 1-deoxy-D-xylulose-5-phosphate synthase [Cyanobium sp. MAG_255]MDP4737233.1 1-deoxy-D-xylulose-5-phosphate synthase [Cyanobium sp. MAG_216]MDP4808038.1 1-deoxy-D-xylulose-5-phosphate synthase [Cyanobium sp. MAG_160]MDP4830944.1 1-deoxy-D-xylulose-5-phosphate synthase [Cyanobium sp. MAG_185]MDP4880901.1 1-deoxy-D-xylulose-5-
MHLSELSHPNQLHGLSTAELEAIARQIRERHLEVVSTIGGHLGPGLGVVELTLALYQTLDLDHDKVVWDVGHQAYPHKLITGRYKDFDSLRQKNGVAGYLKRSESRFDHFGAGHASTSISAALGMALARDRRGEDFKCVAVIGDGALTGGMALEAINHAGHLPKTKLVVVLNDNDMSISPPVGALSTYLNRMRLSPPLQFLQGNAEEAIKHLPFLHGELPNELKTLKESMKRLAVPKVGAVFEELGFTYIGPIDGHDIAGMVRTFEQAHRTEGPVLVHVATTKGKGYAYAEADQVGYHAQSAFDLATGKAYPSSKPKPPSYSKVFGQTLVKLCEQDPTVVGITAAMATGTGLDLLEKAFPAQYFDVGIAEQHAVTMAAGMACEGLKPVVAIYSTFLQRAFDQLIHDVGIQNLPVTFVLDRAGIVGADGPTHQGQYDISYLRAVPNFTVMAPKDEAELQRMLVTSIHHSGPCALRIPRGEGEGVPLAEEGFEPLEIGRGELLTDGDDLLIVAYGAMVAPAMATAGLLQEKGIRAAVINARFLRPLDEALILPLAQRIGKVVTMEEGALAGGFGAAVVETLSDHDVLVPVLRIGIPDQLVDHASPEQSKQSLGLTPPQMAERIITRFGAPLQSSLPAPAAPVAV